jgi:phosphoserine phosphatase RsbU/P
MSDQIIESARLKNALILVVDDIELNRKMLLHSLQAHGFTNLMCTDDGANALEICHQHRPDLVILDLMMPAMDGFSFLRAIRRDSSFRRMPIIVQTVLDDIEKKVTAFSLGASDYICKPLEPAELSARTLVHLKNKFLAEDLYLYKQRITEELETARIMQKRLMPSSAQLQLAERVYDMDVHTHFEASNILGGDSWGIHPLSNHKLAIWNYDFSGHGMSAALNVFRMHTIMQELQDNVLDPGSYLSSINAQLQPLLERNQFATMFYGVIDTSANCFIYAAAASPPPLLVSGSSMSGIRLNSRGFPLGVIPHATYDSTYVPFMPGDLLFLYSDCLTETPNEQDELLTEDDLQRQLLRSFASKGANVAEQAIKQMLELFHSHSGSLLRDDLTLSAYYRTTS